MTNRKIKRYINKQYILDKNQKNKFQFQSKFMNKFQIFLIYKIELIKILKKLSLNIQTIQKQKSSLNLLYLKFILL